MDWHQQSSSWQLSVPLQVQSESSWPEERLAGDSGLDPWFPPTTRTFVLGTVIPAGVVLLTLLYDLLRAVRWPKRFQASWRALKSPFVDFMGLEDLLGEPGPTTVAPIWKVRTLVALSAVETIGWAAALAYEVLAGDVKQSYIGQTGMILLAWTYATGRILIKHPHTPPYLLLLFYITNVLSALADLAAAVLGTETHIGIIVLDTLRATVPTILLWLAGTFPLERTLPCSNVAAEKDVPSSDLTMPEDSVNLWSWMSVTYVASVFKVATKRTLNEPDVWSLSPYFTHKNIFSKYLAYTQKYPNHSLLWFLLASNSLDLILDITLEMWGAVVGFIPPYALQQILAALADPAPEARTTAYLYTFVFFIANMSFAQKDAFQTWYTRRCYERTRGQLFCALHWKSLKRRDVSGKVAPSGNDEEDGKAGADLGKIVNLMQGDAYAVAQRFWEFSGVFSSPVRLTIALIFLYNILGWSALAGVAVVLVAYILNYPLAKYNIYITRRSWGARDKRMNLVNELFQNVRFLKFYGWETRWTQRVRESRETELRWRVKENIVSVAISFIWTWMPSATALLTFLCYTLIAKQQLTVAKAFTSIALFSQLQGPMTDLPNQVFALLHAYVSMQRIEEFLNEPEVPEWASSLKSQDNSEPHSNSSNGGLGFDDATFEWDAAPRSEPSRFTLGPLNIKFPQPGLSLVSGPTGSGKTALLNALLGEMVCIGGDVLLNKAGHRVAYCAQNPWLEHATIKDNIIFGSAAGYDEARYQSVVQACALARDLEVLDAGDLTEIGEKGITLSGGQRARIALARALYSQASIILLDDPLAAVDMHTAQHLVKYALSGLLAAGRTIILVTHHITLCLPIASYLVELFDGKVTHEGSIQDLRGRGLLQDIVEAEDHPHSAVEEPSSAKDEVNEADLINGNGTNEIKEPKIRSSATNGKLVEAEARAEGRVSLHSYLTYIRAAGIICWILTLWLLIQIRLIGIAVQFYLAKWGEAYEDRETSGNLTSSSPWFWNNLPPPDENVTPWLLIYFYLSMAGAFSVLTYISIGYYASLQASRSLFNRMLSRLTAAPTRFFDVTPIGRILNRWTSDMNIVDGSLQNSFRAAFSGVLNFLAAFIVIVVVVPSFAPVALFIAWLYIRLAPPYIQASRDLRRLESISLSPAFAGFDELLHGLVHVRAFAMEWRYQDGFYTKVDKFQSYDHAYWLVANWLRWRYDCLGSIVVFLTTIFALWSGIGDGLAALVIIQSESFAEASRQLVKVLAQLELDFNSVERIVEYLDVAQEAPAVIPDKRPPAYWPSSSGELAVQDLEVRYAPELPAVLKKISFTIKPSEKIGVVGRTGSGKSTLALSLLRIIEPSGGSIVIDGVNITDIGLDDLRTRVTIVSQDVSLFSGTIRSNLDPFMEHSDEDCWEVLERCHLASVLSHSSGQSGTSTPAITLDTPISQTGSLSAGERQLVALARAVLRRSSVVIMDEATSQIDTLLDDHIQRTIRESFANSIVITIAHRLKTVLDYDRILVLGNGEVLEFDTPRNLLEKRGGVFREMCRASADWPLLQASATGSANI
ncbi:pleiotropic drug resistance ABC transporter [Irpex rosettiformis]|uniref:Pleiotropic drug resistance ABC transporter n=1 Tax=Irpex rosettiformis TaxID=378272 RepID=A0ACB8U9S3_9APHY|nr:pleiotropic drug resistance ABC transporter [Irpex rosettiformis]